MSKVFVGTCPDMCPEKERFMRETRKQLSVFEVIRDTEMVMEGLLKGCFRLLDVGPQFQCSPLCRGICQGRLVGKFSSNSSNLVEFVGTRLVRVSGFC